MNKVDFFELARLRAEWEGLFDGILSYIEEKGGLVIVERPVLEYIRTSPGVRENMKLHSMRIRTGLLMDKHIVLEFMKEDGKLHDVLVCRAFEAKAFGEIRYTRNTFERILSVIKLTNNNIETMAKTEKFKKGAFVSSHKLNGEKLLGIYEYAYDCCNECCVSDNNGKYCVKLSSTKPATDEESKIIQETIVKPRREAEKARKKALEESNTVQEEEVLTEEDMEEPSAEELEEAMEASETKEE